MANKVFNVSGGVYSGAAFSAFETRMYGSCVADADSFKVTAGTAMNLNIAAGDGLIENSSDYGFRIQATTNNTIAVNTAPTVSGQSRYDAIVAYIDNAVVPNPSQIDNAGSNILKFRAVAGSAATNPSKESADANIASAIGAANPYVVLAYVLVPAGATSTSGMTIEDNRKVARINLILSTTDIEEGSPLPEGTLYGVYEV